MSTGRPTFVFNTATTANGFLADPHDSLGWLFQVQGESPDMEPFLAAVRVYVMGSSTYEWLLRNEKMLEQPERWRSFFGDRPAFVFTSRELPAPEDADVRFAQGDVRQRLEAIEALAGDGVVWVVGGGDLVGQFLDAGALDRIVMSIAPAFLQAGKPLLPRSIAPDRLRLVSARAVGQFVEVVYDVVAPGK